MKNLFRTAVLTLFFATLLALPNATHAGVWDTLGDAWESVTSGDACNDLNDAINAKVFDCAQEDIVSFSGFKGGLEQPSGKDLSPTLTRAENLRKFTVTVVNFVLGFLGLVAMVIIIYGGFLYVSAAGNEEQTNKAKKSIIYAVVGILIILGSYALVRTLLTATGGDGTQITATTGGDRGVSQLGTNIGQQTIYTLSAGALNSSLNDFMGAYGNLVAVNTIIKKIKALSAPSERSENKQYLRTVSDGISEIKNRTNTLSKTHAAARDLLDGWIAQTMASDLLGEKYENGKIKELLEDALEKSGLEEASAEDFENAITTVQQKLENIKGLLGDIADTPALPIIQRGFTTDKDLERAFAGLDPTITVKELFDDAFQNLVDAKQLTENPSNTKIVIATVKGLHQLFVMVRNVEFVFVRIRTTVREGHAPLIIELNGLDSRDPTGETITDDRYEWDPEGISPDAAALLGFIFTGDTSGLSGGQKGIECTNRTGATIICTYQKPGTYMVRLRVRSTDTSRVATGQAFLPITVLPSVARISLKATAGGVSEELRNYEQDSKGFWNLSLDKSEYQVTTEEAKNPGVLFDASASQAGGGATIKGFEWSFGDGTGIETTPTVQHKYKQEGKFPLRIEVTDTGNRKDRKFVNVLVASIAARMQISKTVAEPDELIEFDGTISRSDRGIISSYKWTIKKGDEDITNNQNQLELLDDTSNPTLRVKFKNPGEYAVALEISDGALSASRTETIQVKSRKPKAILSIRACPDDCPDSSQPNLIELDASGSFDPDDDELLFAWTFYDKKGNELQKGTAFEIEENKGLSGPEAKKRRIKFLKTGTYKIQLSVKDDLPENLQQTDVKDQTIEIASIVEMKWSSELTTVAQLKDGKAHFTFMGATRFANRGRIDFGDGQTNEMGIELNKNNDGAFSFEHDYTSVGSFLVTVEATSENNGKNTLNQWVYISPGDSPLAVIEASVDDNLITLPKSTPENPNPALEIVRNKPIEFDASKSVTSQGTTEGLRYGWDFGDQKQSTGKKVQHSYEDLPLEDGLFTVTLTATEEADPTKTSSAAFLVNVVSKKPKVATLSLEKKTSGITTPVDVELTAENAVDPDGRITNFQFWYYDPAKKDHKLGVIDVPSDHATLTVETAGEEGQEREYVFCISVTDNENTTTSCEEMFKEDQLPHIKVKNGPNKAPVASFTVDRTNIKVGEAITFISSSTDEDGLIKQYIWDFEGNGFQDDNPTELATVEHKYTNKSPASGFRVKLKTIDDKNAAGFSKDTVIHVDPKSKLPVANFSYIVQTNPPRRVQFFDASTADVSAGTSIVKWTWDFDTAKEFNCDTVPKPAHCNGNKTDDVDSNEQNPIFDYAESGTHQVKLVVEDSDENASEPRTTLINVIAGSAGGTGTSTPVSNILNAEIKTYPAAKYETFQGQQKKVLRLPENSNGENTIFSWINSTGDIVTYKLDKNIWCDYDGDGSRENDINNPDASGGTCTDPATGAPAEKCWQTSYQRFAKTDHPLGAGHFTALLTVTDRNGVTDTDQVEVLFNGETDASQMIQTGCEPNPSLGASIFKKLGMNATILLGLVSGVIVVLIGSWIWSVTTYK